MALLVQVITLFFVFILFDPSVYARQNNHHRVLNVSALFERANSVFYSEHDVERVTRQSGSSKKMSNSSFALSIGTRSSLMKHTHKNYTELVFSRVARDLARHNWLQQMASHTRFSRQTRDLELPVMRGPFGEYYAEIGVGQPVKTYHVIIDTGSDLTWVQCEPCQHCYEHVNPPFHPIESLTYNSIPCNSRRCEQLYRLQDCEAKNPCSYRVTYADGSFSMGEFSLETLTFLNSVSVPHMGIGCGHHNGNFSSIGDGLVGLGTGTVSLTSQLKAASLVYCLVNRDSHEKSILEFNPTSVALDDSIQAPMINGIFLTNYYIALTGLSVGEEMLNIPQSYFGSDVIVDSGTGDTLLPKEAYHLLRDKFLKKNPQLPAPTKFGVFDTCFIIESSVELLNITTVSLHFSNGAALPLPPENILAPVDVLFRGICFAFLPSSKGPYIIGSISLEGIRTHYVLLLSSFEEQLQQHVQVHAMEALISCWELEQSLQSLTVVAPVEGTVTTMSDDDDRGDGETNLLDESPDGQDNMGFGPLVPTESERSSMERARQKLKYELKQGYKEKPVDIIDENLRKRRAGKLLGGPVLS